MSVIVPKNKSQKTNKNSEKSKQENQMRTKPSDNFHNREIQVKIDDTVSSIIIKKSQTLVKEGLFKKGKSNMPSELWLG
ncbi:MAG: hypothetical protein HND52_08350 [Ignavibacteriae bacterium]|nr:hypothetical protein [Ignavibacteriota bacterium]NOG97960.1 hypothetical protein [Ignavibacteriota bacterium]